MPRVLSGRVILYLLTLLVLDLAIVPFFRIGFAQPSLGYLMILYATFQWDIRKTIPVALAVGLLRDLVNSPWFGMEMLSCAAAGFLLESVIQKIERTALLFRFLISFVFILLIEILNLLLSNSLSGNSTGPGIRFGMVVGSALYSCALLPGFFYLTAWWFQDQLPVKQYELFK